MDNKSRKSGAKQQTKIEVENGTATVLASGRMGREKEDRIRKEEGWRVEGKKKGGEREREGGKIEAEGVKRKRGEGGKEAREGKNRG